MKRKNDELTFIGALVGDWRKLKDYSRSGELWFDLLDDGGTTKLVGYVLVLVWLINFVAGACLSWRLSISFLTCGVSLLLLAGVYPLLVTGLLLRWMIFKSEQWEHRNE